MSGTLHIYGQTERHAECDIIGTPEALTKLRDALNEAIAKAGGVFMDSFANDGEGYRLRVVCVRDLDGWDLPYGGMKA